MQQVYRKRVEYLYTIILYSIRRSTSRKSAVLRVSFTRSSPIYVSIIGKLRTRIQYTWYNMRTPSHARPKTCAAPVQPLFERSRRVAFRVKMRERILLFLTILCDAHVQETREVSSRCYYYTYESELGIKYYMSTL